MKFGIGAPTGIEGLMYPVPFADPLQAVELAVEAERLGYDGVWGNDHVTTQSYVRAEFPDPPRFYDPYVYLSNVAARTTTLHLATAISVFAFRNPVVLAKQVATLDQLSGGRFKLGVGIGAYREESLAMDPDRKLHRGKHAEEYLQALHLLFTQRQADFHGEYVHFRDVESYPKPLQATLPILSGGNAPGSRERAARYSHGWLPGVLSPDEIAAGVADIRRVAAEHGRDLPADFDVAPQLVVSPGSDTSDAMRRFEGTHLYQHMLSLSKTTLKDQNDGDFATRSLIGSPEQMITKVGEYAAAGATTLSGLLFAANTHDEFREQMTWFAENVIRPYRERNGLPTPAGAGR